MGDRKYNSRLISPVRTVAIGGKVAVRGNDLSHPDPSAKPRRLLNPALRDSKSFSPHPTLNPKNCNVRGVRRWLSKSLTLRLGFPASVVR